MEFPHFLESSNIRVLGHKNDKYLDYDDEEWRDDDRTQDNNTPFFLDMTKPGVGDFMIGGQIYGAEMDLIFLTNLLEARKQFGLIRFFCYAFCKI